MDRSCHLPGTAAKPIVEGLSRQFLDIRQARRFRWGPGTGRLAQHAQHLVRRSAGRRTYPRWPGESVASASGRSGGRPRPGPRSRASLAHGRQRRTRQATTTSATHFTQSRPRRSGTTSRHGAPFASGRSPPATPVASTHLCASSIESEAPQPVTERTSTRAAPSATPAARGEPPASSVEPSHPGDGWSTLTHSSCRDTE